MRRSASSRVAAAIEDISRIVAGEPELAAACTTAVLATDPDVARLRVQIGVELTRRLRTALGDDADEATVDALSLALSGAMLQAGMGFFPHAELAERMGNVTRLVLGGRR